MKQEQQQFGPWTLITGANSGIGAAFADILASEGYNLVLVGRQEKAAQQTADKIAQKHQVKTRAVIIDLSMDDFLQQFSDQTSDLGIGLLVSNAGDDAMGALFRVELAKLKQMLHLNTTSHLELVHHFSRRFEKRGNGGILLVSSTAALQGTPFLGNYAGSKFYQLNLGMALNYKMRKTGVNVTVLLPGPTKTPGLIDKPAIPLAKLPAPQMNPDAVAKIGLHALAKNNPNVISGVANMIMSGIGSLLGRTGERNMWGGLLQGIVPRELRVR